MYFLFVGLGYSIATGPQVETDYYNFEALNIPDRFISAGGFYRDWSILMILNPLSIGYISG